MEFLLLADDAQVPVDPVAATALQQLRKGDYGAILKSEEAQRVLPAMAAAYAGAGGMPPLATTANLLPVGIACLNAFLQCAWTGPNLPFELADILPGADLAKASAATVKKLAADSEEFYHLAPNPVLLRLALDIFASIDARDIVATWWHARAMFIQQRCIDSPAASLHHLILTSFDNIKSALARSVGPDTAKKLSVYIAIETGLIQHFYDDNRAANASFREAQRLSGFQWRLSGAQGRRTKFQQFDVSQLVLLAVSSEQSSTALPLEGTATALPSTLDLNDDTLLESIAFTQVDGEASVAFKQASEGSLSPLDQALLLAFCVDVRDTNPANDGLTAEEMSAFVQRVLKNPNNWTIHSVALLLRSRLESGRTRTVERSVLQIQALVDQLPCLDSTVQERLAYFFCVLEPSRWDLERELAQRFTGLGVLRSAMDIFERLEMWEDVVSCLQMLEEKQKAEDLVVRLLSESPESPKLLCLQGDLCQDPAIWLKAWEVSGKKYARAMRSLGAHYFRAQTWRECIDCYKAALAINPLYLNSWFVIACASMQVEDWSTAEEGFGRVVALEYDNAEAWSNLATVRARVGNKEKAFIAYDQAVRHKRESWKLWMNFLYAAVDLARFRDAIRAMRELVTLRSAKDNGFIDEKALEVVSRAVRDGVIDSSGAPASELARDLDALYAALTAKTSKNTQLAMLYSDHLLWREKWSEAFDARLGLYRNVLHQNLTMQDTDAFVQVAKAALDVADFRDALLKRMEERSIVDTEKMSASWKHQVKSMLRSLIGRTRQNFEGEALHDQLVSRYETVSSEE